MRKLDPSRFVPMAKGWPELVRASLFKRGVLATGTQAQMLAAFELHTKPTRQKHETDGRNY